MIWSSETQELHSAQHINSIDRKLLNEHLLNSADALPNVHLHFEHEMTQCDFDNKVVSFMKWVYFAISKTLPSLAHF